MDKFEKIKAFVQNNKKELFFSVSFVLIAFIAFGLGRLSVIYEQKYPIWIEKVPESALIVDYSKNDAPTGATTQGLYEQNQRIFVASKNGSAYHFVWCESAKNIKEENKIFFSSKEEAEKAGYKPAKNCAGL